MKKRVNRIITAVLTAAITASMTMTAFATSGSGDNGYSNGGYWSDKDNYVWLANDGSVYDIGNGTTFSEDHPDITDPEYFLKEYVCYPGEKVATRNSAGQPKASYTEGTLELLQEFVNSFDWINSTEAERFKAIYDRIGVGNYGNTYDAKDVYHVSFSVLQYGKGVCMDYTSEFRSLATYVGLECEEYVPWANHSRNLVKLNGHWFSTDPSLEGVMLSNGKTYLVDYETEKNRYANEVKATDWYKEQMQDATNQDEWRKQLETGEITEMEYRRLLFPEMTDEEINEYYSWDGYVDGLGN